MKIETEVYDRPPLNREPVCKRCRSAKFQHRDLYICDDGGSFEPDETKALGPLVQLRVLFSIEEARLFFDMMEEHEKHALTYQGNGPKKKMARDLADRTHNVLEEARR